MKKLILMMSLFLSIILGNDTFFLPEQSSDAVYTLKKHIKKARSKIILVTSTNIDKNIQKIITKTISKNVKLQLITSSIDVASKFAIYTNSDVKILRTRDIISLNINLILIDNSMACLSTVNLDNILNYTQIGIIKCSKEIKDIIFYKNIIKRLILRSDPYFI